jgi:hypothetical protein
MTKFFFLISKTPSFLAFQITTLCGSTKPIMPTLDVLEKWNGGCAFNNVLLHP